MMFGMNLFGRGCAWLRVLLVFSVLAGNLLFSQDGLDFNPLGRETPVEELPKQIRIRLEWFELSHEALTDLLDVEDEKLIHSSDSSDMRDQVRALVKSGDAKLMETAMVVARSGQRAKMESIHEFIYPTEYDPPSAATPGKSSRGTSTTEKKEDGKEVTTSSNSTRVSSGSNAELPNATAFETRNLGVTLEVDPVLGADDQTIDLNLAPELVYLVGEEIYGEFRNGDSKVDVKMPSIYTIKTTSQVTIIDGEFHFFGLHTPVNLATRMPDYERKVIMFLRGDIEYVGLPIEEEAARNGNAEENDGEEE